jgi:4-hydroxy-tetrahydrodipicolinate reductase
VILDSYTLKNSWSLDTDMKNEKELLITAKREPEVPGTHTVIYESDVDEISLTHQAKNRHGFAQGAIIAAKWIADKKGVYDMSDLLKF